MSAGIAGNMIVSASSNIMTGKNSTFQELLMTNKNMHLFVEQLSYLRGAALKLGQLLSLDSGDFVPDPIAKIFAEVRNDAYSMPPRQLRKVLSEAWGDDFLTEFKSFDVMPLAAASIGQVHKCKTANNKTLAIKIQYPGVKESIKSDIKNMGFLFKTSGLIPNNRLLKELLEEAKNQLYQEVDYLAEAKHLFKFSKLLENDLYFDVPTLEREFSTNKTLAMEFKSGITIDKLVNSDQTTKDIIIERLIELVFKEIFEFRLIQTDPNFANFLYDKKTKKIVLLDFGATKTLDVKTVTNFSILLKAIFQQNRKEIESNLYELELIPEDLPGHILSSVLNVITKYGLLVNGGCLLDFSHPTLTRDVEALSGQFIEIRDSVPIPPFSTLLVQRKIGGIFMLARRFKARTDLKKIIEKYI